MTGSLAWSRSSRLPEGPTPESLANWLGRTTFPPPGSALRVGVSGGADSLALLALAVAAGCDVTAVHVDHGHRPGGAEEAALVEARSTSLGATFETAAVDVPSGPNLEARMRAARYAVLGPDAATGHTADDQAETVLINLLRGAGLVGLGAMTPGPRRPILALRRADTIEICERLGWQPFVDPTNSDRAFVRNRVRHEVVPLLADVADRDVVPLLVRTAAHAREAAAELRARAEGLDVTNAPALASASTPVAALALQAWIRAETGDDHPIDAASVERVLDVARGASIATEVVGGWRIRRSNQVLSVEPASEQR